MTAFHLEGIVSLRNDAIHAAPQFGSPSAAQASVSTARDLLTVIRCEKANGPRMPYQCVLKLSVTKRLVHRRERTPSTDSLPLGRERRKRATLEPLASRCGR